jgi:hexosaminidase
MKLSIISILPLLAVSALAAEPNGPALLPLPQSVEFREGSFSLGRDTRIAADAAATQTAEYLAGCLRKATGFKVALGKSREAAAAKGQILLTTRDAKPALGPEGYELTVAADSVVLRASTPAGLFYGAQTLLQLLPPEAYAAQPAHPPGGWTMRCATIADQPRFKWRGLMLDVARHFYSKDQVKSYLDVMALHKLNTFHWHLTDDQGWRIEIKKYPDLTRVGAWRKGIGFGLNPKDTIAYGPDGRYGGFFTQDDVKEVVAYAANLHITIVPEIEMPGHSSAALAAYPQYSCSGSGYSTDSSAGVHAGVYCAGNDQTFDFLQDVLTEVIALFPSKYIHIGGDEVPKDNWKHCPKCQARIQQQGLKNEHELQSYFIRRIEKIINAQGRSLIGWSEIREGGLAESAALMDWIGGGAESAASGHDVVMSPTSHCYFDYYQSKRPGEPRAIGGFVPLNTVYSFEPIPDRLAPEFQRHVLGAQANLWTEYIANLPYLQYMTYPRACALSEVVWAPREQRDYQQFLARLQTHLKRLDYLNVHYRPLDPPPVGEWKPQQITAAGSTIDWDVTGSIKAEGKYQVALGFTSGQHGIDIAWVALLEDGKEVSRDEHAGFAGGKPKASTYSLNLPAVKAGARYSLRAQVAGNGGTDSQGVVMLYPVSASTPKTK